MSAEQDEFTNLPSQSHPLAASAMAPWKGWVDEIDGDTVYFRLRDDRGVDLNGETLRSNFIKEDRDDLFEGCYIELSFDTQKFRMLRLPPLTDEEYKKIADEAWRDWKLLFGGKDEQPEKL